MDGSREVEELLGQEDPQLPQGGRKTSVCRLITKARCVGASAHGVLLLAPSH